MRLSTVHFNTDTDSSINVFTTGCTIRGSNPERTKIKVPPPRPKRADWFWGLLSLLLKTQRSCSLMKTARAWSYCKVYNQLHSTPLHTFMTFTATALRLLNLTQTTSPNSFLKPIKHLLHTIKQMVQTIQAVWQKTVNRLRGAKKWHLKCENS